MQPPISTSPSGKIFLWPLVLAVILYGRHLGGGYLADDFLYLHWLEQGLNELLERVTWQSNPQMLRPLPAFPWMLSWLPGGAIWQHGLSVLLHASVGGLLAGRVAAEVNSRRSMTPSGVAGSHSAVGSPFVAGSFYGAIFVACPLLVEPVVWLSSATDLWAAALALLCLHLAFPPGSAQPAAGHRLALAGLVFAAALLSKETVLALPLVAVALLPGRPQHAGSWRPHRVLTMVAALYLAVRWILFSGPGGYLEDDGTSQALTFDPITSLRNLGLQLPWRLLWPLIRDESLPWPLWAALGSTSMILVGGFALTSGRKRAAAFIGRLGIDLLAVGIALGAAFLPVVPVFSIDSDHGGGRLLYWPMVIALWGLSRLLPWRAAQKSWALALVLFWSLSSFYNGNAWSQASRRLEATLQQLPQVVRQVAGSATPTDPGPSIVYLDGNDSWRGAYLWRNGFLAALARHGIGDGIDWRLGNGAVVEQGADLGRRVQVWGLDEELRLVDQTPCELALMELAGGVPWVCSDRPLRCLAPSVEPADGRARGARGEPCKKCPAPFGGTENGSAKTDSEKCHAPLERPDSEKCHAPSGETADDQPVALRIIAESTLNHPLEGRVLWRRGSRARFNISDSRAFRLSPQRRRVSMRVGPSPGRGDWQIELWLAEPERLREISSVVAWTLPELCR